MGGRSPRVSRVGAAFFCVALACSVEESDPGGVGGNAGSGTSGSAGTGLTGATGGDANAGATGTGGSSTGGGSAGVATGGAAGSPSAGGTGGENANGGSAAGGTGGNGGQNGGSGGTSGQGGALGGASSGASGSAGTGSAGGPSERCDIANAGEEPPASVMLSGNLGTHDPVVIAAHDQYYLFSTGNNIGAKTSNDLRSWQGASDVWNQSTRPDWIAEQVPEASNLWAPDISYFGGQYHLYYSASSFGCNVSCIGHATREALNAGSWTDHGSVVCSNPGASCGGNRPDNWNAIDPNVIVDAEGKPWLAFGSFWGGLKMIELDENGDRVGDMLYSIAARPRNGGALEAPFIVRRCGYYYLFLSWDTCCQGSNSTYNIRVGRSETVTGPYVDQEGTELMEGGGTLVLEGDTRWRGPGHNAVIFTDTGAYNVYHSYDANSNGASMLRFSELVWDADGWPISGGP